MIDKKQSFLEMLTDDISQATHELVILRNKLRALGATKSEHVFDSHEEAKKYLKEYFMEIATLACVPVDEDDEAFGEYEYRERYIVGYEVYLAKCSFDYNPSPCNKFRIPAIDHYSYDCCGDFDDDEYGEIFMTILK